MQSLKVQLCNVTRERDLVKLQFVVVEKTRDELGEKNEALCLQVQRLKEQCDNLKNEYQDLKMEFERFKNLQ